MVVPPLPVLGNPVATAPAVGPGTASLSAPAANCSLGACAAYSWAVTCAVDPGNAPGPAFNLTGAAANATIGFGAGNKINLAPLLNYTCTARQMVTDVLGRTVTGAVASFKVRSSGTGPSGACPLCTR